MKVAPRYDGPPIMSIGGRPDDQRAPLLRQRRRFAAMLDDLSADDWRAPSRCENWSVQDVVAHLVGVNAFWNASVQAGLAGAPTRVLVGFDPAATPQLMIEPMRVLEPGAVLEQFVQSNEALIASVESLDDAAWSRPAETPAGHVPIRLLAHHALWDAWVHERDVALPLSLSPPVEADEVVSCLRYAAALSPAFAISDGRPCAGEYAVDAHAPDCAFLLEVGDSVAVRDGAAEASVPCVRGDAVELLEALSLRVPLPASTPPEWRQVLGGLANAFDSELPV